MITVLNLRKGEKSSLKINQAFWASDDIQSKAERHAQRLDLSKNIVQDSSTRILDAYNAVVKYKNHVDVAKDWQKKLQPAARKKHRMNKWSLTDLKPSRPDRGYSERFDTVQGKRHWGGTIFKQNLWKHRSSERRYFLMYLEFCKGTSEAERLKSAWGSWEWARTCDTDVSVIQLQSP